MACPNPLSIEQKFGPGRVQRLDTDGQPAGDPVHLTGMVMSRKVTGPHCHVEGCRWRGEALGDECGLARLGVYSFAALDDCGRARRIEAELHDQARE